ncbi:MAG TPA: integrase core domain-containing protein [Candidatus Aminicenantes bacterium]|nr:integrase core domain-containing protein [Candidatus Aminicenantes bacterium]
MVPPSSASPCSPFVGEFHQIRSPSVQRVDIEPRSPRLNGKVERSRKIYDDESYRMIEGTVIDDAKSINKKHNKRENFHNHSRPHEAHGGQTPYQRFRESAGMPVLLTVDSSAPAIFPEDEEGIRQIDAFKDLLILMSP